jgi:apolipoprotein N-acyltransferase
MRRLPRWTGAVAALAAGAAWPLAFAPFAWSPLALLALALLFALWREGSPWQAFRRGYLFGLGMFGVGVYWVYISMYWYGGMGAALSVFITALLAVTMAIFPALAGLLGMLLLRGRGPLAAILVLPAVWTLAEWMRGWFLTGFTWLQIGYSQIDTPLAGYAPLFGVYGLSLCAALSAALLCAALARDVSSRLRAGALGALALLWLGGAVLAQIEWSREAGSPLRVALVQGNIPQDLKWAPSMREASVELYTRLSRPHWASSDLVVWPETAIPMTYAEARPWLEALAAEADAGGASLLAGLIYVDPRSGRYYNSMVNAARHHEIYHKRHLVPFTEYLPFRSVLGDLIDAFAIPMSDFASGAANQPPISAAGQRLGMSICFEDAFGEELIRDLPEATLLVNVSNDAWFRDSAAPAQHLQIARMRALETGRWLARGTNTGMTAIIDHRGRLTAVAPPFTAHVLTGEVQPRTGSTPYVLIGNQGFLLLALCMLLAGLLLPRSRH